MDTTVPSYLYTASFPTGSSYICDPPVLDTDIDIMYLTLNLVFAVEQLERMGWTLCGQHNKGYTSDNWCALRKGKYNALLTDDLDHFYKFLKATMEAKRLNLLKKEDRVALFEKIVNAS